MADPGTNAPLRAPVIAAALAAGAMIAQQVAGKATRDALFLSSFDVVWLPPVAIASSLLSLGGVLFFSALMARHSPTRVVRATFTISALLLLIEWAISLRFPAVAAIVVFLHMAMFGATVISGFWSLINERFDPYTAKRVVGRIGAGGTAGGVVGGLIAWRVADHLPTGTMLALMALLNLVCVWGLRRLGAPPERRVTSAPPLTEGARSGFAVMRETPYLRYLAALVALSAAIDALLDYVLSARASATFTTGPALLSFFAIFHTATGVLTFLLQTGASRIVLKKLGLSGATALLPGSVVVLGLVGIVLPGLPTAVSLRGGSAIVGNSLYRSAYELLYTPLAPQTKRPTKTIIDVGFDRLGAAFGSVLVLIAIAMTPGISTRILIVIAILLAVVALAVAGRIAEGYVEALATSLRTGAVHLEDSEIVDATTRRTLSETTMALDRDKLLREIQSLRESKAMTMTRDATVLGPIIASPLAPAGAAPEPSEQERERLIAALRDLHVVDATLLRVALSKDETHPVLVPSIIRLLARNDVSRDAMHALQKVSSRFAGTMVDHLLDRTQPVAVRRRIPRVLETTGEARAIHGLLEGLGDPVFEVRVQCGLALARIRERMPSAPIASEPIFAAAKAAATLSSSSSELEGAEREERTDHEIALFGDESVGDSTTRVIEHFFTILSVVLEREPLRMAYRALRSEDEALRGTALEYLENVLPSDIRQAIWPAIGGRARRGSVRPMRARDEVLAELKKRGGG